MPDVTNICVKCSSSLERSTFQSLEVELCRQCGGLWLDRGEISRAAKLPAAELARLCALLTAAPDVPPIPSASIVPCPACPGRLSEVMLGTVPVHYCNRCQGIFLDKGELEDAINAVR